MRALNTRRPEFPTVNCVYTPEWSTPPSQYLCLIAQIFSKARKIFPEYLEVIEGLVVLLTLIYLICIFL